MDTDEILSTALNQGVGVRVWGVAKKQNKEIGQKQQKRVKQLFLISNF